MHRHREGARREGGWGGRQRNQSAVLVKIQVRGDRAVRVGVERRKMLENNRTMSTGCMVVL